MITYADKTQDTKIPSAADGFTKPRETVPIMRVKNNRPEAIAQIGIQAAADGSGRVKQLREIQDLAGNLGGRPIQAKAGVASVASSGRPIQAKFVIQRNGNPPLRAGRLRAQPELSEALLPQIDSDEDGDERRLQRQSELEEDLHDVPLHSPEEQLPHPPQMAPSIEPAPSEISGNRALKPDPGKLSAGQFGQYSLMASGPASAGAGKFSTLVSSADAAATASSYLGAIAGGLGAVSDTISYAKNVKAKFDSSNSKKTREVAGYDATSSGASVVKSSASALVSFLDKGSIAAAGATMAAGAAGLIMGFYDFRSGLNGMVMASLREKRLNKVKDGSEKDINLSKKIAIGSQQRAGDVGYAKMIKGVTAVAGSVALLVGATPIGWGILSAAALIGAAASAHSYYKKRQHKREMAIDILGVRAEREQWKVERKAIEDKYGFWHPFQKRKALAIHKEKDPLDLALKRANFTDPAHCYNHFVVKASTLLFEKGVENNDEQSRQIIKNIGLVINKRKKTPNPQQIAAKISI